MLHATAKTNVSILMSTPDGDDRREKAALELEPHKLTVLPEVNDESRKTLLQSAERWQENFRPSPQGCWGQLPRDTPSTAYIAASDCSSDSQELLVGTRIPTY